MEKTIERAAVRVLSAVMAIALVLPTLIMSAPKNAFADTGKEVGISGVDFMQTSSTELEVLKAENLEDKSVFIDLSVTDKNGNTSQLLKLQEYDQKDRPAGTDYELAQIITLNLNAQKPSDIFSNFGNDPVYRIAVYPTFYGGEPLYQGAIYPIYAELVSDEGIEHRLIGIRTASSQELAISKNAGVGETIHAVPEGTDGDANESSMLDTYTLQRSSSGCDVEFRGNSFVAKYVKDADASASDSVTGAIRYVDAEGNLIRIVEVPRITSEGKEVYIDPQFTTNGKFYRVLSNLAGSARTISYEYPTLTVRVIEVLGMDDSAYSVTIYYVGDDNEYLWEDTIDVKGYGYQYTLPETFSMTRTSGVAFYKLMEVSNQIVPSNKEDQAIKPSDALPFENPVVFDRTIDADSNFLMIDNKRAITAKYSSKDVDKALTVVEVDGSTNSAIETTTIPITRDQKAEYRPEDRAEALASQHGADYVSWSGNEVLECSWEDLENGTDMDLLQYAYYLPEGYAPTESYTVDVQYMNVADSSVIKTDTVMIEADQAGYINLNGPERFTSGANTYVRLAGQDRGFNHSYYTSARTYTVYYRDVNDVINANTVIDRVQIIDTPLAPTTTTITATATIAPGAPAAAVETGITAGDGTAVITDDATPLANFAGEDTVTERTIADNENPLAASPSSSEGADDPLPMMLGISGALAGLLAVLAAIYMLRASRRKQDDTNPTKPNLR